jgi:hypothetical protein
MKSFVVKAWVGPEVSGSLQLQDFITTGYNEVLDLILGSVRDI